MNGSGVGPPNHLLAAITPGGSNPATAIPNVDPLGLANRVTGTLGLGNTDPLGRGNRKTQQGGPINTDPLGLGNRKTQQGVPILGHQNIWAKKAMERARTQGCTHVSQAAKNQTTRATDSQYTVLQDTNNSDGPPHFSCEGERTVATTQVTSRPSGHSTETEHANLQSTESFEDRAMQPIEQSVKQPEQVPSRTTSTKDSLQNDDYSQVPGECNTTFIGNSGVPKQSTEPDPSHSYVTFKPNGMQHQPNYSNDAAPVLPKKLQQTLIGEALMEHDSASSTCVETPREWIDIEYQRLLECISDEAILVEEESFRKLSKLVRDFRESALTYGKVIISELCLPPERKQIRPAQVPGFAGGEKFYIGDIMFRVSVDSNGLYGSDELAAKEASHQLKGLTAMATAGVDGLCFPLLALLDYRGFRVVATSILPIDGENTLCYGSSNGGKRVATGCRSIRGVSIPVGSPGGEPSAKDAIAKAAKILGLKEHFVQPRDSVGQAVSICMPTDIEVHQSQTSIDKNGYRRLYVLDFARLFPSQPPWWSFETKTGYKTPSVIEPKVQNAGDQDDYLPVAGKVTVQSFTASGTKNNLPFQVATAAATRISQDDSIAPRSPNQEEKPANRESEQSTGYSRMVKKMSGSGQEYEDRAPHLVHLLRPELVKQNKEPLSSDSFSRFGLLDAEEHNAQVALCFERLLHEVIPAVANELEEKSLPFTHMRSTYDTVYGCTDSSKSSRTQSREYRRPQRRSGLQESLKAVSSSLVDAVEKDGLRISHLLHRRGVNMRFLGLVRQHVINPGWKNALLHESVSRCAKATLREVMRNTMTTSAGRISGGATTKVISNVTNKLNEMFGKVECCTCPIGTAGNTWWCVLPRMLQERFRVMLSPSKDVSHWKATRTHRKAGCGCCVCFWRSKLCLSVVFARMHKTCGLILSPPVVQDLEIALAQDAKTVFLFNETKVEVSNEQLEPNLAQRRESSNTSLDSLQSVSESKLFSMTTPFEDYDVDNIECRIKLLPVMEYSQGTMFFIRARNKLALNLKHESERLARHALERFDAGLALCPDDPKILCNKGFLLENLFSAPIAAFNSYRAAVTAYPNHALFISHHKKIISSGLRVKSQSSDKKSGRLNTPKLDTQNSDHQSTPRKQTYAREVARRASSTPIGTYSTDSPGESILDAIQSDDGFNLSFIEESIIERKRNERAKAGIHGPEKKNHNFSVQDLEEECYKRSLDANSKLVNCLKDYANFLRHARQNNKLAGKLYKKALEVNPTHIRALTGYANLLADSPGKELQAHETWAKCVEVAPHEPVPALQYAKSKLLIVFRARGLCFPGTSEAQLARKSKKKERAQEMRSKKKKHGNDNDNFNCGNEKAEDSDAQDDAKIVQIKLSMKEQHQYVHESIALTKKTQEMALRHFKEDQSRGRSKPKLFSTTDLNTYLRLVKQLDKLSAALAKAVTIVEGCQFGAHEIWENAITLSTMFDSSGTAPDYFFSRKHLVSYIDHLREHLAGNQNDKDTRRRLRELESQLAGLSVK